MEQMAAQATHCGAELILDAVAEVDLTGPPFSATLDGGDVLTCDALIVATGAQARWLGLEGERRFAGAGVSACATCDGFFFRGKRVAVVGGGNTAVEEALYLAQLCEKVTLVHRRDALRAEKVLQDRLFRNPRIEILWNHVVADIVGNEQPKAVTGLVLRSTVDGSERLLAADGLFVAIGHDPATALFRGKLAMDGEGYIVTAPDSTRTSVPGVFAAGDVQDKVFRQAVTAAGTGCMAALEAERWLSEHGQG
jgi:thioredoxin reductase (NADPH)